MKRSRKGGLLDTNVILRFLLDDDIEQSPRAHVLMRRLERGEEQVDLEECVLAEVVWVLETGLNVPRADIAGRLSLLIAFLGLRARSKRVLLSALAGYARTDCDIVDCLLAARARRRGVAVRSFDTDFKKLDCAWEEPE